MCARARPGGQPPGPSTAGHYGEAVFRPEQPGEDDRIDLGALAYDDTTMARLRSLGVGPGWNCLDVGAGTGTVARRLLHEAGVATVLAVDRDVRFLTAHPFPGLGVLEADISAPGFDPGRFQLVHARFVLMHLPSRHRLIAALGELLAPGGVLVLSDAVDLTTATAPTTPYTRVVQAMWQGLRDTIGTDVSWVPEYPRLLRAAGSPPSPPRSRYRPWSPGAPSTASGPAAGTGRGRRSWPPDWWTTRRSTRRSGISTRPIALRCRPE